MAAYGPESPPFSEKTYRFFAPQYLISDVWISSTLNSDRTISYWVEYPMPDYFIQAAMLRALGVPITTTDLYNVVTRYHALYTQLVASFREKPVQCQSIDPEYVNMVIDALLCRKYVVKNV